MVNEHESSLVNSNLEERITTKMILIRPPYPPKISPKEILLKLKSPNAFIIYRNEFVKELRKNNYKIRQSIISPMVASSWNSEPQCIKDTYFDLAREADKLFWENYNQDNNNN
ncbi:7520_t:CDS:2, partial [Entrophospora sp. SA101]